MHLKEEVILVESFLKLHLLEKKMLYEVAFVCIIGAVLLGFIPPRANIPNHLLNHPIMQIPDMIPPHIGKELNIIMRELKDYPTNMNGKSPD